MDLLLHNMPTAAQEGLSAVHVFASAAREHAHANAALLATTFAVIAATVLWRSGALDGALSAVAVYREYSQQAKVIRERRKKLGGGGARLPWSRAAVVDPDGDSDDDEDGGGKRPKPLVERFKKRARAFLASFTSSTAAALLSELTEMRVSLVVAGYALELFTMVLRLLSVAVNVKIQTLVYRQLENALRDKAAGAAAGAAADGPPASDLRDPDRATALLVTLWSLVLTHTAYETVRSLLSGVATQLFQTAQSQRSAVRQRRFMRSLLTQDKVFYTAREGRLDSSVLDDANAVDAFLLQHVPGLVRSVLEGLACLLGCLVIDWQLTLVSILSYAPGWFGVYRSLWSISEPFDVVRQERTMEHATAVREAFGNIDLIKMSAAEELTVRETQAKFAAVRQVQRDLAWPQTLATILRQGVNKFTSNLDLSFAAYRALTRVDPPFTLADWTAFSQNSRMEWIVYEVQQKVQQCARSWDQVERYLQLRSRKGVIESVGLREETEALKGAAVEARSPRGTTAAADEANRGARRTATVSRADGGTVAVPIVRQPAAAAAAAAATADGGPGLLAPAASLPFGRTATSLDADESAFPVLQESLVTGAGEEEEGADEGAAAAAATAGGEIRRPPVYAVVTFEGRRYRRAIVGHVCFSGVEFEYPRPDVQDLSPADKKKRAKKDKEEEKKEPAASAAPAVQPKDSRVLRGLTFDVPPGTLVALVGASGSGKTTVFRLLTRMYDADTGGITLDGHPISAYAPRTLRRCIGYVEQAPRLLSKTVRENILFGFDLEKAATYPTDEELVRVCKAAQIHDVITAFDKGYDEPLTADRLSGGQKQRVAIARALIRDPKLLLLDEATSALDPPSEEAVTAALQAAMRGRTTFVIAHRLSTVVSADLILLMDGGRIVEAGTHKTLLAAGGRYSDFVRPQLMDAEGNSGEAAMRAVGKGGAQVGVGAGTGAGAAVAAAAATNLLI
jgi:ABC-type multidrug transport system fused ATPase/permease subunit